jgi:uncharacterized membrane protein
VTDRRLRAAVAAVALAGAGLAAYLVFVRETGGALACTTGGCELVQGSRYAEVAGIPVAVIGLVGYLAVAASALVRGEPGAALGLALSGIGFAFAMYLVYVQVALIDAICVWCLASDTLMALLLALGVLRLRRALGGWRRAGGSVDAQPG